MTLLDLGTLVHHKLLMYTLKLTIHPLIVYTQCNIPVNTEISYINSEMKLLHYPIIEHL